LLSSLCTQGYGPVIKSIKLSGFARLLTTMIAQEVILEPLARGEPLLFYGVQSPSLQAWKR
jgi:hypothetical protein